jgi:hypothetical protein
LLLQQQVDSSKQLQELGAAANSSSTADSTLQAQLQNLGSSVASFMAEFKHWQEQHATHGSTVLMNAECQTTPGLAAAAVPQSADKPQHSAGGQSGMAAQHATVAPTAAAAAAHAKVSSRGRAASLSNQTSGGRQQAAKSGSLIDFLFSQHQPPKAAPTAQDGPSSTEWLPSSAPEAMLSPSRALLLLLLIVRLAAQCSATHSLYKRQREAWQVKLLLSVSRRTSHLLSVCLLQSRQQVLMVNLVRKQTATAVLQQQQQRCPETQLSSARLQQAEGARAGARRQPAQQQKALTQQQQQHLLQQLLATGDSQHVHQQQLLLDLQGSQHTMHRGLRRAAQVA